VSLGIIRLKALASTLGKAEMNIWATFIAQRNQVLEFIDGHLTEQSTRVIGRTILKMDSVNIFTQTRATILEPIAMINLMVLAPTSGQMAILTMVNGETENDLVLAALNGPKMMLNISESSGTTNYMERELSITMMAVIIWVSSSRTNVTDSARVYGQIKLST